MERKSRKYSMQTDDPIFAGSGGAPPAAGGGPAQALRPLTSIHAQSLMASSSCPSPPPPVTGAPTPSGSRSKPLIQSETGRAVLVPALLCGVLGPLCWMLGSHGWSFRWSLWCSFLVIYSINTLREKIKRSAKLEADRVAYRKRILQEDETTEWLNTIFYRVWQFHEPLLCEKLRETLALKLEQVRPSRIQAFEISRFTLGKRAPFMSSARIITRTPLDTKVPEDRIALHMGFGFHAPELEVLILARTGVATIPIAIKDFWIQGRMRMELELVPRYPHAETASFTFLEKPIVEFELQPLGVNVMEVPYIANIIQNQIVHSINEHLLDPAKVVFNLMTKQDGLQTLEAAGGVMFVTVIEAVYPGKALLGPSEYYCKLKHGDEIMYSREVEELAGEYSRGIRLNETFAMLAGGNIRTESLLIQLKQKRITTSKTVGSLQVSSLDEAMRMSEGLQRDYPFEGNAPGHVTLRMQYHPLPDLVLEQTKPTVVHRVNERTLSPVQEPGAVAVDDDSHPSAGALLVCLHKAQDLLPMDTNGFSDPFAIVYYGDRELFRTKVMTRTLAPQWECSREFSVADVNRVKFTIRIFDLDALGIDDALGDVDLDLKELFAQEEAVNFGRRTTKVNQRWFRIRKPGPVVEKELTVADLKQSQNQQEEKKYGYICLSIHFRPLPLAAVPASFRASVGNGDDDVNATCYNFRTRAGLNPPDGPKAKSSANKVLARETSSQTGGSGGSSSYVSRIPFFRSNNLRHRHHAPQQPASSDS